MSDAKVLQSHWRTIIIGGGQAGLAMGYQLKKLKEEFIILDERVSTGDSWTARWDSLKLFSPAWATRLPGANFPKVRSKYPSKNDMAYFLREFEQKHWLPVLHEMKVTALFKTTNGFELEASGRRFTADHVVVATGNYAVPKIPEFAKDVDPGIAQFHSSRYKRPGDIRPGDVLVVGAATTGLQIALELAKAGRKVFVSGNPPRAISPFMLRYFRRFLIWMMNNRMTIHTRKGKMVRDAIKVKGVAAPLINISLGEVVEAGAMHVARIQGVEYGTPVTEKGHPVHPSTIIWCTGFSRDFSWIKNMPGTIDQNHYPVTYRGVSTTNPGLYFLGMAFQYALTSSWVLGVGRDAAYIAEHIHTK